MIEKVQYNRQPFRVIFLLHSLFVVAFSEEDLVIASHKGKRQGFGDWTSRVFFNDSYEKKSLGDLR